VTTTVSLQLQAQTRAAVVKGLQEIDARNGYARKLEPATQEKRAEAIAAGAGELTVGREVPGVVAAVEGEGFKATVGDAEVSVAVPAGSRYDAPEVSLAEQFPVGAVVELRIVGEGRAEVFAGPESAVVVADVPTGEVLAMVGGSSYDRAQFNRALQARRQPGSSFKPFVYGAALQSKDFTAATLISDSPEIYEKWKPTNFLRDRYRGDIRMRSALTSSVNTVAIKLADSVGIDKVHAFAEAAGIETKLPDNLSIALGTGEVTPFEMSRAYLTLARGGERIEPALIREVVAPGGRGWVPQREAERALPEDVVFILASMMQSVVQQGTGAKAKALGRPVAGKTGTSGDYHDAWFAGFTPQRVAITWVGFDRPRKLGKGETGGKAAVPIWLETMKAAGEGDAKGFLPPPSVLVRNIDADSGLLVPTGPAAADYAGKSMEEYFLPGTEPKDEAVPAALPKGDVLLGLYGEEPTDAPADEDDPPKTAQLQPELPSLDD
jgi:penicillin-binding protein 1A